MIIILDPCTGQTCSGKGSCNVDPSDTTKGYNCACDLGYTGDNCENG